MLPLWTMSHRFSYIAQATKIDPHFLSFSVSLESVARIGSSSSIRPVRHASFLRSTEEKASSWPRARACPRSQVEEQLAPDHLRKEDGLLPVPIKERSGARTCVLLLPHLYGLPEYRSHEQAYGDAGLQPTVNPFPTMR